MIMLPEGAEERMMAGANTLANECRAQGIENWEIVAYQSYGTQLDIEAGKITMAAGGGDGGYGLRVVDSGRFGYAHLVDVSGASHAVKQAVSIAKASPSIAGFELPDQADAKPVDGMFDSSILDLSSEDLLEQADSILSAVSSFDERATVIGGGLGISVTAAGILTSNGIEASGLKTTHGVGVQVSIDENDEMTSSWEGDSSRTRLPDVPGCVESAVKWAQITRGPLEVEAVATDCPVLMTSEGFSPLFSMVVPPAVKGERLARQESFWSGKMNENVVCKDLTIVDDGRMQGGSSSGSRDGEGVPSTTKTLVENGRLISSIWATRDAAKMVAEGKVDQAQTTASATRGGHQAPPGCGVRDLTMTSSIGGHSQEQLLAMMGDGYIVHSVMGAHTANPTSGDFSVTTSTILKVEDGEILGPLKQAGLSGNMAKALSGQVYLGDDVRKQGSYTSGSMHLPDVLLMEGFRVNPA